MTASQVNLGPQGDPRLYRGRVTALSGGRVLASASDGQTTVGLRLALSIDRGTGRVSGTATARPAGEGS